MKGKPTSHRFLHVRMRFHYTWLVALVLIIVIVTTQFPEAYALWRRLLLGVLASVLFLAAIVIRQLAVNFVASRRGIKINGVTLFVFGSLPVIAQETTLPILELLLALSGLLSGVVVFVLFYMIYIALVITGSIMIAGLVQWLTFMALMLAFFNFIPGFPLDGGRILRAMLWRANIDYDRATRIVSRIGRGLGLLFVIGGIALLVITRHQWFTGLVLAFAGWVLERAASQSSRQAVLRESLHGITVGDAMARDYALVSADLTLSQLLRDHALVTGRRDFMVAEDAKLRGIVAICNLKSVPKRSWASTCVREIMAPVRMLDTARPNQPAADILEQMNEQGINVMPVLEGERLVGLLVRDSLNLLWKTRSEFRM